MTISEIFFIAIALSMDAFAVGMTDGMSEPRMGLLKTLAVAGAFAFFQFGMPLLGYGLGAAFAETVAKIAPWLSFALLAFIGGKALFDCAAESLKARKETALRPPLPSFEKKRLGAGKLLVQAVATSLDALAVGVTLLAAETASSLPAHFTLCALLIGTVTMALSVIAVSIGKRAGDKFSEQAEALGGFILIAIGIKILLEGIL